MDRVALVGICWFALWIAVGVIAGRLLEMPGFGGIYGFVFALVTTFLWPWVLPNALLDWMDD